MSIRDSQNFLHNKDLVRKIVNEGNLSSDDVALEIGPGKGIITNELINRCKEVYAVELDAELYNRLQIAFKGCKNLHLINQDFLSFALPQTEYKVFSNIPFNITADILTKLLTSCNSPKEMYLIMQYEAVLKYAGEPYYSESLKSLMFKPLFHIDIAHEFSANDFVPKPNAAIVLAHFHKKEFCDVKKATMQEYWDFLSYIFTAPGKYFKEKTKKVFSYEQQKRLRKSLGITDDAPVSSWNYKQWIELFDCYNRLVCKEKKVTVVGAYQRLLEEQTKIDKIHRNRNSSINKKIPSVKCKYKKS